MFTVYILKSERTGKHYIGYASDMEDRLRKHNNGSNKSTRSGVPWRVVYKELYRSKKEAWLREKQIKSYKGGEAFKRLVIES